MRKKIAVVGDKGSVLGFKSVGFEVFMTTTQQETREVMQALCKADYGIIFITEQAYLQVPEIIDEYKERPTPARELSAQTSSSMKISVFVFRPAGLPAEIDLKVGENIEPRQNC